MCEIWWHKDCIEGMSDAYLDQIIKTEKMFGWSGFLCRVCRKVMTKLNKGMKDMEARVTNLEEKKEMALKIEVLEKKVGECKGEIKVVETGLTKAKEEVKEEMKEELKDRDERSENIGIYGLLESKKKESKERVKEDEDKVKELWGQMEVQMGDRDAGVKFQARKPKADGNLRPLILQVKDPEKRERILDSGRKLAQKEDWKRVFVAPDLTPKQREEEKKKEAERKKEAEEKTKKDKDEGKNGMWIVVGKRGRRRVVWMDKERES